MAQSTFSQTEYNGLVRSFVSRGQDIAWLDWLPVAMVASEAPERWVEAFGHLELSEQFALLEVLHQTASGPLGDGLLLLLAHHEAEIEDDQVRQFLIEDAVNAQDHNLQRLQALRDQIMPLTEAFEKSSQRVSEGFDLAEEIIRLERELARVREGEFNQDERFSRIHDLERSILKIETQRHILDRYDEPARKAYLAGLETDVESLTSRKTGLEQEIGQKTGIRDRLRHETEEMEREAGDMQDELTKLQSGIGEARKSVELLRKTYDDTKKEDRRLNEERRSLVEEADRTQKEIVDKQEWCQSKRKALVSLREDADRAGLDVLVKKIEEVYQLLPADKADEGFSSMQRRTR